MHNWKTDTRSRQRSKANKILYYELNVNWRTRFLSVATKGLAKVLIHGLGKRSLTLLDHYRTHLQNSHLLCRLSENRPESSLRDALAGAEPHNPTSFCQTHSSSNILSSLKRETGWGHEEWSCNVLSFPSQGRVMRGKTWSYQQYIEYRESGAEGLETGGDDGDRAVRRLNTHHVDINTCRKGLS